MTADDGKPLKMIVNGAAGTGKSRLIRALVNRGHLLWGKTESQYGSVLVVVGPTGCSAFAAGGYTWQSALSKTKDSERNACRKLLAGTAFNLQSKFKGAQMLIFDEFYMLSCNDLVDVERRLRAA